MRLIDADYLYEEFKKRQRATLRWKEAAVLAGNDESMIRADAVLTFLCEVKLTIDNAPTVPNPCGNPCNFTRSTGEWICTFHSTFPQYEPSEYRCSKCNGRGNESDKFCKHCGAKMEVNING